MGVQINGDTGNISAIKADYSGNVTIGGTLTYEDVTNIDSVGLVTARSGIEVGARPGVAASISVDGNMIVSGISTFGGDVQVPDKIIHAGDTNTAIRFPTADTVTVETGGSERVRIDSSGSVGVNVNSPAKLMHVSGSYSAPTGGFGGSVYSVISNSGAANNNCGLSINAGNNGVSFIQLGDTDDANIGTIEYNNSDNSMVFDVNASERLRIGSDGAILVSNSTGIGIGAATNGSSSYPSVTISGTSGGAIHFEDDGDLLADIYGSSDGLSLSTRKTNDAIIFQTNSGTVTEKARIDASGYMGLGTNSPSSYNNKAYNFVIASSGNAGMTIAGGTSSDSSIYFADGTSGAAQYAGWIQYEHDNNALTFGANENERLRLASDGTFTNSGSSSAPTSGSGWGFTTDQLYLSTAGTSANYALRFYNDNGLVGSVLVNGSGVTYNTSSDYRLKENEVTISDAISKVKQLKPYTFNFKADSNTTIDGFFAHEAQEVIPYAVTGEKDAEEMQSMDYGKLTPLLTAALQEAITKIETLEADVAALKSN